MIWLVVGVWLGSLAFFVVLRANATKNPPKAASKTKIGHERRPPPRTVSSASPPEREAA